MRPLVWLCWREGKVADADRGPDSQSLGALTRALRHTARGRGAGRFVFYGLRLPGHVFLLHAQDLARAAVAGQGDRGDEKLCLRGDSPDPAFCRAGLRRGIPALAQMAARYLAGRRPARGPVCFPAVQPGRPENRFRLLCLGGAIRRPYHRPVLGTGGRQFQRQGRQADLSPDHGRRVARGAGRSGHCGASVPDPGYPWPDAYHPFTDRPDPANGGDSPQRGATALTQPAARPRPRDPLDHGWFFPGVAQSLPAADRGNDRAVELGEHHGRVPAGRVGHSACRLADRR